MCKANEVLHELHCSTVTKWVLSNITKLSVQFLFLSSFLTYGHEFWVITKRILSQVQAAGIQYFWQVHTETLWQSVQLWSS